MAQAQVIGQQRSFNEDNFPHQSVSEPGPYLQYSPQAFGSSTRYSAFDCQMADSILRGHCTGDSYMPSQPWILQHSPSQDNKPSVATSSIPSSNSLTYPESQNWAGASSLATTFDWQCAMQQVEPYIMPADDHFRQNQELVYNPIAAQNTVVKGADAYGGRASWVPSGLNGLPRGVSANGSDADTSSSMSPKSYISDDLENSYSPGTMSDYTLPVVNWHGGYSRGSANPTAPSSQFGSYPARKMEMENVQAVQMGSSMAMTVVPSTGYRRQADAITTFEDVQQSGSEYSYSQGSSPRASPWFQPNYAHDLNGLPLRPRNTQDRNPHSASDTSLSSANDDPRMQYRSATWTGSRANVPAQSRMQDRFQVPRNAGTQAQRQRNDELLIEGKKRGLTYKTIKGMMVGEEPAESTLRGRYRSLTKDRKDRVRKPHWTKTDIDLLNEIVQQEFDRTESNLQNPHSLSFDQKLTKVPWKKVAEYIDEQGGSYHFGNSTCKRKWLEVNPGRK